MSLILKPVSTLEHFSSKSSSLSCVFPYQSLRPVSQRQTHPYILHFSELERDPCRRYLPCQPSLWVALSIGALEREPKAGAGTPVRTSVPVSFTLAAAGPSHDSHSIWSAVFQQLWDVSHHILLRDSSISQQAPFF